MTVIVGDFSIDKVCYPNFSYCSQSGESNIALKIELICKSQVHAS